MKCPVDGTMLQMSDKQGIEIDYCPNCRGVWLDRGELDKIIQRSDTESQSRYDDRKHEDYSNHYSDRSKDHHSYHRKKKGGFLSNIFEGFGD